MSNYLVHMQGLGNNTAFDRRARYNAYNFASYIEYVKSIDGDVLEIGPGLGELIKVLNDRGVEKIDILDNDKAVLSHCKKTYRVRKDILSTGGDPGKYLKGKYDLIVLTQVFEHIKKDSYMSWLKSLYLSLRPGGYILITVPNGANPFVGTERYGDLQHENMFTVYSFNELMTFAKLPGSSYTIKGFEIPPTSIVNVVRIVLQKILHAIFIILMIINGAIYQTLMTPNITLSIHKSK